MQNINEIEELIKLISKLPGLGPKSAKRIVLRLMNDRDQLIKPLANVLTQIYKIEMNNGHIKDNIKKIKSKSTTEFVQHVVKHHNQWKNDNLISKKLNDK